MNRLVFLPLLERKEAHTFLKPVKAINSSGDVTLFLSTHAYDDITTFILQLNSAMFPRRTDDGPNGVQQWELGNPAAKYSSTVTSLKRLLDKLEDCIHEAPPDTGPRRFGNVSFRKWYQLVSTRISGLLDEHLPPALLSSGHRAGSSALTAKDELQPYLMNSFGSDQRLDYGTGHELSFLAFLGGIWKLGGFDISDPGAEGRGIVLGVIEP